MLNFYTPWKRQKRMERFFRCFYYNFVIVFHKSIEAIVQTCLIKKASLKISQNSQKNTFVGVS